jgi:leader peptidase (prepilin peptidase)/N-methyltransferase
VDPETRAVFIPSAAFALGAIIGSFLNVVIYRLPRANQGLSLTHPRLSLCPACGATIRWYDNIPLVSYFLLLGRCRACRTKIPLRYFGVELLTASLFAVLAIRFLGDAMTPERAGLFAVYAALLASFVAVTFIDVEHLIIPDAIDIPGMVLAPALSAVLPALHLGHGDLETLRIHALDPALEPRLYAVLASLLGLVVGGGVIWLIGVVGSAIARKEAMGFGDVKLLAMIGGYLGWKGAIFSLLLASFAGSILGIPIKLATRESHIPFGPFLVLGAALVIFFRHEIVTFIFVTYPEWIHGR